MNEIIQNIESGPVYQPELSTYIFYGKGYLEQIDVCLHNKLIKKEVYLKTLNSINKYYLNQYIIQIIKSIIIFNIFIFKNGYIDYYFFNILFKMVK